MSRHRLQPGDGDPRHGTANGYNNLGCRCRACTDAIRDHMREWTHRTGRRRPWAEYVEAVRVEAEARDNHGTEQRYKRGCRCATCRAGVAEARRIRRLTPNVAKHGTHAGYSNGCRCDACREAANAYRREWKAARRAAAKVTA